MKKYTHAWIAYMAIRRLEAASLQLFDSNGKYTQDLVTWLMRYNDDIIKGAWYPDDVIKDMANSHVLKFKPSDTAKTGFDSLARTSRIADLTKNAPLRSQSFVLADKDDNLPDRVEAIAHSIVDHLKMQWKEPKGSPVAPTSNHIALLFFMLSHYVADAHMPLHCDARAFSSGKDVHAKIEDDWDKLVKKHYEIDSRHNRFFYDKDGFPLQKKPVAGTWLEEVESDLQNRKYQISYGSKKDGTWDYARSICQHSYLLSHLFIPESYTPTNIPTADDSWKSLGSVTFDEMTVAAFSDAIDAIARIWFRLWRRYEEWKIGN